MSWRSFVSAASLGACLSMSLLTAPTVAQVGVVSSPLIALAPGGTLPALKSDVFAVIPADAYGFVVGTNLLKTKETVEKVLRKLEIPFEDENDYEEFTEFLDDLEGWNDQEAHALAVVNDENRGIRPVVIVPVTNYKKFAESLGAEPAGGEPTEFEVEDGPDGLIAEKSGFAVLVGQNDEDLLTRFLAAKTSVSPMVGPVREWLGKHQVAGVVLPAGLKAGLDAVIEGLETAKEAFPAEAPQAEMVLGVFDVYADMLKGLRDEATLLAAGVRLSDESGFTFAMQATFKPDGKFAAAAKGVAPLSAAPLKGLPEGDFFVAGAGVVPQAWISDLMRFSMNLSAKVPQNMGGMKLTPEEMKEFAEAAEQSAAGVKQVSVSMGLSGGTLLESAYAIYETDDAKKFLENYEKSVARMAAVYKKSADKDWPEQSVRRRTIDGRDVVIMTTDMSKMLEHMGENQPPQAKMAVDAVMSMFLGKNGKVTAYATAADDDTVVVTYDEDSLSVLADDVKRGKAGLADDVNIKKAAAMLPHDAHWIGFLTVGGYVELIKKVMSAAMAQQGAAGVAFPIPPFPNSPPVGMSARITSQAVEGTFVVPMDLMEAVRDYVNQVKLLFGAGLR